MARVAMTVPTQPTPATDAPPTPLPEVPEGTTTVQSPNLSVLKKRAISEVVPDPPLGAHGTMAAGGEVKDEEKGPAKKKPKMTEEEKEQKRKEKEAKENEREAKVCLFFLFDQPAAGWASGEGRMGSTMRMSVI